MTALFYYLNGAILLWFAAIDLLESLRRLRSIASYSPVYLSHNIPF